jgi:hypothetical protein
MVFKMPSKSFTRPGIWFSLENKGHENNYQLKFGVFYKKITPAIMPAYQGDFGIAWRVSERALWFCAC